MALGRAPCRVRLCLWRARHLSSSQCGSRPQAVTLASARGHRNPGSASKGAADGPDSLPIPIMKLAVRTGRAHPHGAVLAPREPLAGPLAGLLMKLSKLTTDTVAAAPAGR